MRVYYNIGGQDASKLLANQSAHLQHLQQQSQSQLSAQQLLVQQQLRHVTALRPQQLQQQQQTQSRQHVLVNPGLVNKQPPGKKLSRRFCYNSSG